MYFTESIAFPHPILVFLINFPHGSLWHFQKEGMIPSLFDCNCHYSGQDSNPWLASRPSNTCSACSLFLQPPASHAPLTLCPATTPWPELYEGTPSSHWTLPLLGTQSSYLLLHRLYLLTLQISAGKPPTSSWLDQIPKFFTIRCNHIYKNYILLCLCWSYAVSLSVLDSL